MPDFDFRKHHGEKLPDDPTLADGVAGDHALGLCSHMLGTKPNVDDLVGHLANFVIVHANANKVCTGALLALVVKRVIETAREHIPGEHGEGQARHCWAEVAFILDADPAND